jgi:hypothetical protein
LQHSQVRVLPPQRCSAHSHVIVFSSRLPVIERDRRGGIGPPFSDSNFCQKPCFAGAPIEHHHRERIDTLNRGANDLPALSCGILRAFPPISESTAKNPVIAVVSFQRIVFAVSCHCSLMTTSLCAFSPNQRNLTGHGWSSSLN